MLNVLCAVAEFVRTAVAHIVGGRMDFISIVVEIVFPAVVAVRLWIVTSLRISTLLGVALK